MKTSKTISTIIMVLFFSLTLIGCTKHKDINQLVNEQIERSLKANPNLQVTSVDGDVVILEEKPKPLTIIKNKNGSVDIQ